MRQHTRVAQERAAHAEPERQSEREREREPDLAAAIGELLTVPEAAALAGRVPSTIYQAIYRGQLHWAARDDVGLIERGEVLAWMQRARRRPTGAPSMEDYLRRKARGQQRAGMPA